MVAALIADGFRNYLRAEHRKPAEELLVDRAQLLTLTAPEMTVLIGGMRALNTNARGSEARCLHTAPGAADQRLLREPARHGHGVEAGLAGRGRVRRARSQDGKVKWTGTRVDLVFGSNSQLRALAEVYAKRTRRRSLSKTSWRPGTR